MKVLDIFNFLNNLFPVSDANDYDNVGLLVGDCEADVSSVLIALDCTKETINNALQNSCELIVTHHPVIFSPLKTVLSDSIVSLLVKNNISVICMHTNLDVGKNGVNDCLCRKIGLDKIKPHLAADGYLLKSGVISPVSAEIFAKNITEHLGGVVKYVDGGKLISNVLVCSGSGGDFIVEAINHGFDALVTADIKHHQFLLARDNGISLFDAGHYHTEDIIVEDLKSMLLNRFDNLNLKTYHPNTIKFAYIEN